MKSEFFWGLADEIEDHILLFLDDKGVILDANKAIGVVAGYTKPDILGKSVGVFYSLEEQQLGIPRKLLQETINCGRIQNEGLIYKSDGSSIRCKCVYKKILDPKNNSICIAVIFKEISHEKVQVTELLRDCSYLSMLLMHTDEIFILLDAKLNIVTLNQKAKDAGLTYLHREVKPGDSILDFASTERIEFLNLVYYKVLQGIEQQTEMSFEDGNGDLVYFRTIMKPVINNAGETIGVFVIERNITESVIKQQQIDFDWSNMNALVNCTSDMMWSIDLDYNLITSNSAFEDMVRDVTGERVSKGINVLHKGFKSDQLESWKGYYNRVFAGESFTVIEFKELPIGIWTEVSFFPIRRGEQIIGTACYAHNITNIKKAEAELIQSEETRRLIMESSMDAIICIDQSGAITFWNPNAYKMFGWEEGEILGRSLTDTIMPPQYRTRHIAGMKHHSLYGDGLILNKPLEFSAIHKNGSEFPIELRVVPIKQNSKIWFCAFIRDITERKLAEEKSEKANRLYLFVSNINQTIVHVDDEEALYKEVCRIAVEIGKYDIAWIGIPNEVQRNIKLVAQCNATSIDQTFFNDLTYDIDGPTSVVIASGNPYVINDFDIEPDTSKAKTYASLKGFKSSIALPIKLSGQTIATLNLFSVNKNSFDCAEIKLLEEVSNDISYALENFENDRHRKEMERAVIHNELRLVQAQSIAHIGSWEADITTGIEIWSDEACRIYGLPTTDNRQTFDSWLSFIHPEDLGFVLDIVNGTKENITNAAFHHRIIRRDGSIRYVYSQSHFEFDTNGKPIGKYGVAHDVTEIKEAEKLLCQAKSNLRQIVDLVPQSIFAMDSEGKLVFINKSFSDLYGIPVKELINKSIYEVLNNESEAKHFITQAKEVIATGKTIVIPDFHFIDYLGNKKVFFSVKVPFDMAGKSSKAMLGISLDITEQKNSELERSKMIDDMVLRNKDLEQFSYIVSHNLRLPVANIKGLVELIQNEHLNTEERKVFNKGVLDSVRKLDGVIADLNHVLQVKNEVSGSREFVSFTGLLDDIKISIANLVKLEHVQISVDFSEVEGMHTLRAYIYSIFYNLISNSIKYRQPNEQPIITITSKRMGNKFRLIFQDNGLGIDLKKRGNFVFGLYKRFHAHTEGKGVGLFMVKTQVETLGGTIAIVSEVNKGTEFIIEFDCE